MFSGKLKLSIFVSVISNPIIPVSANLISSFNLEKRRLSVFMFSETSSLRACILLVLHALITLMFLKYRYTSVRIRLGISSPNFERND